MQEEVKKAEVSAQEILVNPIDGTQVDEIIKESEAKKRGYLEPEHYFRYLEDENEFVKLFIVNGKKIIVDMARPQLQYKKPVLINQERVLNDDSKSCSLDNPDCVSCGS